MNNDVKQDQYIEVSMLGTIHKRRRQFLRIFDTPHPHVGSFLVLSVGNFDRFLTPLPPPNCGRHLWTAPKALLNLK